MIINQEKKSLIDNKVIIVGLQIMDGWMDHLNEQLCVFLSFGQLDSKAQGQLKEGMKIYKSDPGLKKSWDNVQKMVSTNHGFLYCMNKVMSVKDIHIMSL